MTVTLVQKLREIKDLKGIVETTVNDLVQSLNANCGQILLANPLDPNSALMFESSSPNGLPPEIKPNEDEKSSRLTIPLDINGRGFGTLSLIRNTAWLEEETDSTRVLAGKIGEIIRQAQLNDITQRDTFRNTFLVEINNLMTYSLGVGDALFMVVNILGKALRCSRCIFVCTDDKSAGWKCYEYWQQDKVKSCQECHWPTNDSSLIAQTLAAHSPIKFYEGQANSYLTPAQAELQFSNTRSLLALPLLHDKSIYGCVIIQQCDYRRDWTVNEMDTVQSVADRVAEALAKLPEEKRIHKPIMQLHQRIVAAAKTGDASASLAQSLKGAFGQQSIPSARETLTQLPAQDVAAATTVTLKSSADSASALETKKKQGKTDVSSEDTSATKGPSIVPVQRKIKTKLGTVDEKLSDEKLINEKQAVGESGAENIEKEPESNWGNLDAIPTPAAASGTTGLGASMLAKAKIQQSLSSNSPLKTTLHKNKVASSSKSAAAATTSDQSLAEETESDKVTEPAQGETVKQIIETDSQAREKVERVLSTKKEGKSTSEYVFAVKGVDLRTLGRINGWVLAIEQKDRYLSPHAVAVAEYACGIAKEINLPEKEIEGIRLAALVHDVGKLGISGEILQKPDDELDDAELLTTMRHPIDGSDLLTASSDLAPLAPIVLAHHEEYSGNGYPQGLKGEEIPLGARIIYIANSYHGMVSDTRSGKSISEKEAQEQLKNGSGKQYDPTLIEAFLQYLKDAQD